MSKDFVGIQRNARGQTEFVKSHRFRLPDARSRGLMNEAEVLRALSRVAPSRDVRVPRPLSISRQPGLVTLTEKYVPGRTLNRVSIPKKKWALQKVLDALDGFSKTVTPKSLPMIPRRENVMLPFLFFSNAMLIIIKDMSRIGIVANATIRFVWFYFTGKAWRTNLSLVHGELFPDSILVGKQGQVIIVDWEAASWADRLFDIADVPRLFLHEIPKNDLILFIKNRVTSGNERRKFLALTLFRAIQTIAHTPANSPLSPQAVDYLTGLYPKLEEALVGVKKTLYERVNAMTLTLIARFNEFFRLDAIFPTPALILCYHSVSDSGWRFSTPIREFTRHIAYLKSHFTVTTLSTLVQNGFPNGHVAITFDDGYADVYRNALPILKRYGLPATVFSVGDRANVNRAEIDNHLTFMSVTQLKALARRGWEVGFHTATHPDVRKLNGTELTREIVKGKQALEKTIGTTLRYFAYPRGLYTNDVIDIVRKAGFDAAFTADGGAAIGTRPLLVDRIPLEGNASVQDLKALLSPPGLFVERIFLRILQVKEGIMHLLTNPAPSPVVQ